MRHCFVGLWLTLSALLCGVAFAQPGTPLGFLGPPVPMPPNVAELDDLMSGGRRNDVAAKVMSASTLPDIGLNMNWSRTRLLTGGSAFHGYLYFGDLWRVGTAMKTPEDQRRYKMTSALMLLYVYALILVDGPRCEDHTAPAGRTRQLFQQFSPIFDYASKTPVADRRKFIEAVQGIERETRPRRTNDAFLCLEGAAQTQADFEYSKNRPERKRQVDDPSQLFGGRTAVIDSDPNYRPKFVDESSWGPRQATVLSQLPATLAKVLEIPSN